MNNKEKLEAIREVIKWVDSKKQDLDNGLEEIQYILTGGITGEEMIEFAKNSLDEAYRRMQISYRKPTQFPKNYLKKPKQK
jgi:hypothetical protein